MKQAVCRYLISSHDDFIRIKTIHNKDINAPLDFYSSVIRELPS